MKRTSSDAASEASPNRRDRRAATAGARQRAPTPDALADSLRAVHAEAGGALDIYVVGEADALALILDALGGSRVARALLRAAEGMTVSTAAPDGERPLCLCCPAVLRTMRGVRIGIAIPSRADPTTGIAFALCPACAAAGDADDRVLGGLRGIWPDARRVVLTDHVGGRA